MQHRADDHGAADARRDRVERQRAQPDQRPAGVGGAGAGADAEDRRDQVAAHAPADHQVERGEPLGVPLGERHHVLDDDRPPLAPADRGDDHLGGLGRRRAARVGDQQGVLRAGRVDDQRSVDLLVLDPGRRLGRVGGRDRPDGVVRDGLQRGHQLRLDLWRGHHGDGQLVRGRVMQRPDVRHDEAELEQEDRDHQQRCARGDRVLELGKESLWGGGHQHPLTYRCESDNSYHQVLGGQGLPRRSGPCPAGYWPGE